MDWFPFSAREASWIAMAGFVFAAVLDAAGVLDRVWWWLELRKWWKR